MAKKCLKCNASVNENSYECPFCGSNKFESPTEISVNIHKEDTTLQKELYSEKIMSLIDIALSDGELTEKEKQVLFKKAEIEGIDLDEFEMVLDSKLKQIQKSPANESLPPPIMPKAPTINSNLTKDSYVQLEYLIDLGLKDGEISEIEKNTIFEKGKVLGISQNEISMILNSKIEEKNRLLSQSSAPKSDKFGDVKKCPACGAMVQSFQTKCIDCNHEFSNIEANTTIQKLFKMLDEVESQRDDKVTAGGVIGGLFKNSIGGGALSQALGGGSKTDKRKKEIISSFPIPNTKDDILEFLSLAFPKAKSKGNFLTKNNPEYIEHNEFVSVWKAKCEQVIMKAKFSMKDDRKALEEIMQYAKEIGIK
ncbi:MAG: hypothetical protein JSU07_14010 [Bacteroidetes bacterium]|nr:hypothetical protein [Bacteroidota bacterium]